MRRLWHGVGRLAFWLTWPLLYVYLRFSTRTRVLMRCGDELLLVQGWFGAGDWTFPGGGLHRGEDPAAGAVREVYEETGISLKPEDLVHLFDKGVTTPHGLTYRCAAFAIELPAKPKLKKPSGELVGIEWQSIARLRRQPAADQLLIPALETWEQGAKL